MSAAGKVFVHMRNEHVIAVEKEILQLTRKSLELKGAAATLDRRKDKLVEQLELNKLMGE